MAANVGQSVLDVGCGLAPYVSRLGSAGITSVGIDLDAAAVAAARKLGREVVLGSAYDLPFGSGSFDSVLLVETLEHLPDYRRALAEAARVARRSIVVTVPDISCLPVMSQAAVVPWHMLEATHINFFTPETLRATLLQVAPACQVTQLGRFFEVGGVPVYMHAAATALVQGQA